MVPRSIFCYFVLCLSLFPNSAFHPGEHRLNWHRFPGSNCVISRFDLDVRINGFNIDGQAD